MNSFGKFWVSIYVALGSLGYPWMAFGDLGYLRWYWAVMGILRWLGSSQVSQGGLGCPWVALRSSEYLWMSLRGCYSLNIKCPLQTYSGPLWWCYFQKFWRLKKQSLNGRSWSLVVGLWRLFLAPVLLCCDVNSLSLMFSPQRTEWLCHISLKSSETMNQTKSFLPLSLVLHGQMPGLQILSIGLLSLPLACPGASHKVLSPHAPAGLLGCLLSAKGSKLQW